MGWGAMKPRESFGDVLECLSHDLALEPRAEPCHRCLGWRERADVCSSSARGGSFGELEETRRTRPEALPEGSLTRQER
jgi:hypothetical protein